MRKTIYTYAMLLAMPIVALMSSCKPRDLSENDVFTSEEQLIEILEAENPEGYKIYNLNDFLDPHQQMMLCLKWSVLPQE